MKTLVVYDSEFGNTKIIAQAIADRLSLSSEVKTVNTNEVTLEDLGNVELLVVGSPTQGGRPKQTLQNFLDQIPAGSLKEVRVAAFDTRLKESELNIALRLLVKTIGYAAPKINSLLVEKGGTSVTQPEGFFVKDREGPLNPGEEERAKEWGADLQNR